MGGYLGHITRVRFYIYSFVFFFITVYLFTDLLYAAAYDESSADTMIQQLFCNVQNIVSGTVAQGVAILIIAITGYSFFMGKISTSMLFIISGGILLVFGAPAIIPAITSGLMNDNTYIDCDTLVDGGGGGGVP